MKEVRPTRVPELSQVEPAEVTERSGVTSAGVKSPWLTTSKRSQPRSLGKTPAATFYRRI